MGLQIKTVCKQSAHRSRQMTTPTPRLSIFTHRMLFLTPNQQCQSTEGKLRRGYCPHSGLVCYINMLHVVVVVVVVVVRFPLFVLNPLLTGAFCFQC